MFCGHCGTEANPDRRFCTQCGMRLGEKSTNAAGSVYDPSQKTEPHVRPDGSDVRPPDSPGTLSIVGGVEVRLNSTEHAVHDAISDTTFEDNRGPDDDDLFDAAVWNVPQESKSDIIRSSRRKMFKPDGRTSSERRT